MKKLLAFGLTCLFLVSVTGCFRHSYNMGGGGTVEKYSRWHHHLIWGLADVSGPLEVDSICGAGGGVTIYERTDILNWLVGGLTGGIYVPTVESVSCSAKSN